MYIIRLRNFHDSDFTKGYFQCTQIILMIKKEKEGKYARQN